MVPAVVSTAAPPPALARAPLALLLAAGVTLVVDLATKAWAVANLMGQPPRPVAGDWLRLVFATNQGAAFGVGSERPLVPIAASAVVCVGLVLLARTRFARPIATRIAIGALLGGTLGNLYDRLFRTFDATTWWGHQRPHGVVDFIAMGPWPAYNIADLAIVGGGLYLLVQGLRRTSPRAQEPPA